MPAEFLSQVNTSSTLATHHTPTQSLLTSLRSPIGSLDELEDLLLRVLAAIHAIPPPFTRSHTPLVLSEVLHILPTIQHVALATLLPTWLAPLRDAGHLQLIQHLFCPRPQSLHDEITHCEVVLSALPTILSHLPMLQSKDPGPTAVLDFCISLLADISAAYPVDIIHRSLFSSTRDDKISNDRRMRDWEDYVRAACSLSGKVANALHERTDISSRESLEHGTYFTTLCMHAEQIILNSSNAPSRGFSQGHLFLKLVALGLFPPAPPALSSQPSFFAATMPTIRRRDNNANYDAAWAALVRALPATAQHTFIVSLLAALDCDVGLDTSKEARKRVRGSARILHQILGALGTDEDTAESEQLRSTVEAILCGPRWTWNTGIIRAVIWWIAEPQQKESKVNDRSLEKLLEASLATWTDPTYIRHSLLAQHRHSSTLLLFTLAAVPNAAQRVALSSPFISSITTYLGHLDEGIRRCGMLVAEVVAQRCGKTLAFSGWDGEGAVQEWAHTVRTWQDDWSVRDEIEPEEEPSPPISHASRPTAMTSVVLPRPSDGYDSDDSLAGYTSPSSSRAPSPSPSELEEMERDPTVRAPKPPPRPVYVAQLAPLLRAEEAERVAMGLETTEELVRRKKGFGMELEENAVELTFSLLRLHDNFELPTFDERRQGALTALVASCPRNVAPTLIEQFFTNQYAIDQRVAILAALALGVRELASLSIPPRQVEQQMKAQFPSKMLPPSLHRRYVGESEVQSLLERISTLALAGEEDQPAPQQQRLQQPVVRERQLRVGRLGSTRVTSTAATAPAMQERKDTTFTEVAAEYFIMPLVNHMWRHLRTRGAGAGTGIVLTPVVLAQFLGTLAVLLHAARHAPAFLAVLAPAGQELVLTLATSRDIMPEAEKEQDTDAAVLVAALEASLVILEGCVALDGGQEMGLGQTALLFAVGEWVSGVLEAVGRGRRISGEGGAVEGRVGRAAFGVLTMIDKVRERWGRAMVGV